MLNVTMLILPYSIIMLCWLSLCEVSLSRLSWRRYE